MRAPTPFARILRDTLKLITLYSLCICCTYSKPTTWIWTHKQNDEANKTNKERNACELYRKFIHLIVPTPYLWTIACLKTTRCSNCYVHLKQTCVENWGIPFTTHSDIPSLLIHLCWHKQPQGTWDMYSYTHQFFTPTIDRCICVCIYIYIYIY